MFTSLEKISLDEFIDRMEQLPPKKIRIRKRNWLKLIAANKLTCPVTNKKVAYCSYDERVNLGTKHYNFYSEDGQMFTIDHIIPLSKGGAIAKISNIQPMIDKHNWDKGNKTNLGY